MVTGPALTFRLLVAAGCILGPTVLFLGFWRLLGRLREGDLVARLADRGVARQPDVSMGDVLETVTDASGGPRRCERCGVRNRTGASACRRCGRSLE
ncbi:hypothetical protein BRD19_04445 [Halobacteriales archaeon SW_7_65_23]|nr:MAG: hypothetical protein BRD19_04445 [Halobacteriales archaeon SW_7_65_23]